MKAKLLAVAALLALPGVQPAAATTYFISNTYEPFLTGSITTDGNTGVLSTNDILSFDLTINNGLIPVAVLTPSNSQVYVQGTDLFATASTLSFDYPDTSPGVPYCCDADAGRLSFFNYPNPSNFSVQFISAGYLPPNTAGYLFLESNIPSMVIYQSGPELSDQVIASTPLPAALPFFATGLGAMGLLGWRRKRKNNAAIAAA